MNENADEKITYSIAKDRKDLEDCFSLVYKEYARRRYIPKHYKSELRMSLHNALPASTTFMAKKGKALLATVTVIPDSPMGFPMDKIYKKEVDSLRKKSLRVAETSQLAMDSSLFPKGWFSMFNFKKLMFLFKLFKLLSDHSMQVSKVDELCIAVNPKQQYIYKFIFFEPLGGLKYYGSVNKAPAVAFHRSFKSFEEKSKKCKKALYTVFYGKETPSDVLNEKYALKVQDLEYFFIEKSDLFQKATKQQLEYIKSCYPGKEMEMLFKKHKLL